MVAPSVALAGAKLANNPNKVGSVIVIILSIVSLIIGGTLLAVGLSQTPNSESMIIGATIALVLGVVLFGVGIWLGNRKTEKTTLDRLQEMISQQRSSQVPIGTSYESQGAPSLEQTQRASLPPALASDLLTTSSSFSPQEQQPTEDYTYRSLPAGIQRPRSSSESFGQPPALTDSGSFVPPQQSKIAQLMANPELRKEAVQIGQQLTQLSPEQRAKLLAELSPAQREKVQQVQTALQRMNRFAQENPETVAAAKQAFSSLTQRQNKSQ